MKMKYYKIRNLEKRIKQDEKFRINRKPGYYSNSIIRERNGGVKHLFDKCLFIGIDLIEGNGVDFICRMKDMNLKGWDVVISTEMLEHDCDWELSMKKMVEVLRPNGLLIITCAGITREEHGTSKSHPAMSPATNDWYKNLSKEDFESVLLPEYFLESHFEYGRGTDESYFYGVKK